MAHNARAANAQLKLKAQKDLVLTAFRKEKSSVDFAALGVSALATLKFSRGDFLMNSTMGMNTVKTIAPTTIYAVLHP
jgi:hypothetical protein